MTLKEVLGESVTQAVSNQFFSQLELRDSDIADKITECFTEFITSNQKIKEVIGEEISKQVSLLAICPLDGRYSKISDELREYFSEYALIKYRVEVEIAWLEFLINNVGDNALDARRELFGDNREYILNIFSEFSIADAMEIKEIEKITNHDVKAVEYFIGEKFKAKGLDDLVSLIHIGCTSEDITNLAYAIMLGEAISGVYLPAVKELISIIEEFAKKYKSTPMLARTHGQPATPTTLGKEFKVYSKRLAEAIRRLEGYGYGKFNGATGNYSAISIAFPNSNWQQFNEYFVNNFGLEFNPITTQIESHDNVCRMLDDIKHVNMIIMNMDIDMWMYISMEYFNQIVIDGEVGSSTMPHKVNPIKSENSEGNTYIANWLITGIVEKLMRTRMQRDLSDSTVQRNYGMVFGYSLQVVKEAIASLKRYNADVDKISADLNDRWEVLAEPIQTMLRKYGVLDAYEQLKELTRGKDITKEDIHSFVEGLDFLSYEDKKTLLELTPQTYIGYAERIVDIKLEEFNEYF